MLSLRFTGTAIVKGKNFVLINSPPLMGGGRGRV